MPDQERQPAKKPRRTFSVAAVTQPVAGGGEHTAPAEVTEEAPEKDHVVPAAEVSQEASTTSAAAPDPAEESDGPERAAEPVQEGAAPPSGGTATSTTGLVVRTSPAEQHLGALARRKRGNISKAMYDTLTRSLTTELMSLRSLADRITEKQAGFENVVAEARALGYPLGDINRLCIANEWFELPDDEGDERQSG